MGHEITRLSLQTPNLREAKLEETAKEVASRRASHPPVDRKDTRNHGARVVVVACSAAREPNCVAFVVE